jgi:ankyrin repeat protein
MAAFFGNTSVVKRLLTAGADATVRNHDGYTARDAVIVKWNSDLEGYYRSLETPLGMNLDLDRIREQRPEIDSLLADSIDKANVSLKTVNLIEASYSGDVSAIRRHLEFGTELNQKETIYGNSPLMLAAIFGHAECAKLLVDAGASTDGKNNAGATALHLACFFCRPKITSIMLEAGADTTVENAERMTAYELVSARWNPELEAVYRHVYQSIKIELDIERIKESRDKIAKLLELHNLRNDQ